MTQCNVLTYVKNIVTEYWGTVTCKEGTKSFVGFEENVREEWSDA